MNWMEYSIELLDKLAWPLVVAFSVLILKKPILNLIPLAKTIKYKDIEVEFGRELHAVAEDAGDSIPDMRQDKKSRLIAMVKNLPNGAVLETWKVLEETAAELIAVKYPSVDLDIPTRYKQIETTLGKELIDTKTEKIFRDLRLLRNKVAHAKGFQVDKVEAIEYIELCFKLNDYLRSIINGKNS